jgi:hypothetical protein
MAYTPDQLVRDHVGQNVTELILFLSSQENHDYQDEVLELRMGTKTTPEGWEIASLQDILGVSLGQHNVTVFLNTAEGRGYHLSVMGDALEEFDPEDESLQDILEGIDDVDDEHWELLLSELKMTPDYQEPLSFWTVDSFLAHWLSEQGEAVQQIFGLYVWGRVTYGQQIASDYVIEETAKSL